MMRDKIVQMITTYGGAVSHCKVHKYGNVNKSSLMSRSKFWDSTLPKQAHIRHTTYGRCIHLSVGLLVGLAIDKVLFVLTKGASIIIPPLSVLLLSKGKVFYTIRFDKVHNKYFERVISHFIKK